MPVQQLQELFFEGPLSMMLCLINLSAGLLAVVRFADFQPNTDFLFTIADHVRQHPIRTRHPGGELPVPNHTREDIVPATVTRDQ